MPWSPPDVAMPVTEMTSDSADERVIAAKQRGLLYRSGSRSGWLSVKASDWKAPTQYEVKLFAKTNPGWASLVNRTPGGFRESRAWLHNLTLQVRDVIGRDAHQLPPVLAGLTQDIKLFVLRELVEARYFHCGMGRFLNRASCVAADAAASSITRGGRPDRG